MVQYTICEALAVVNKNVVVKVDGGRRSKGGGRALWHGGMWGGNANQISM